MNSEGIIRFSVESERPLRFRKDFTLPKTFLDLLFILSILFLASTILLAFYFSESQERSLPTINLVNGEMQQVGNTEQHSLHLTLPADEAETVLIEDERISINALPERLAALEAQEVSLRVDKSVPFERLGPVMLVCHRQGVAIAFVFVAQQMK